MEQQIKKISILLYVVIALLAIDTFILFTNNVEITTSSSNKESNTGSNSEQTNTDYDVSMFDSVTADEMIKTFDEEDIQVIYIGKPTCGYCVQFLPMLQQAQKEFGYKTKYYDLDTFKEEDREKILSKDNEEGFLSKNFGSTPMVLLVKDGSIVDGWVGYAEYDSYAEFLTKNGFEKD